MTQPKRVSSDCELGELKNPLIKKIVITGVIDNSLRERKVREPNLTVEKAVAIRQSTRQTKIHTKEEGKNLQNTI